MDKMADWMKAGDRRVLDFCNLKLRCGALDTLLPRLTHAGGATFTIIVSLMVWLLRGPGFSALLSLGVSHAVVHVLKKRFTRVRPFLKHDHLMVTDKVLHDYSFPSGHTTAICSLATTMSLAFPVLSPLFAAIALMIGLSRLYLGLHYPSDVAIGAMIGVGCALLTHAVLLL